MHSSNPTLTERLISLGLRGLASELEDFIDRATRQRQGAMEVVEQVVRLEEGARRQASLERREKRSKLGCFKPMAQFDFNWPTHIDRALVERCLRLRFFKEGANVLVVGPHGVGKTTLVKNIGHAALLAGHRVLFVTASKLVAHLCGTDSPSVRRRRLSQLANIDLLLIDELGYLSYSDQAADLLFELVSRRYDSGRSMVVSTNLAFRDWGQIFPNAACTIALVDRLTHRADIVKIEASSWRRKEASERMARADKDNPPD